MPSERRKKLAKANAKVLRLRRRKRLKLAKANAKILKLRKKK